MAKEKVEQSDSIWIDSDDYDYSSPEYKFIDLMPYDFDEKGLVVHLKNVRSALEKLPGDTSIRLKMSLTSIEEYSKSHIYLDDKSCEAIVKCAINGSVISGHSTVKELLKALKDSKGNLSQISYENFSHSEGQFSEVENEFGEIEGGSGDYELLGLLNTEGFTDSEIEFASDCENYLSNRDTLGVKFYDPYEFSIFIESSVLGE